MSPFDRAHMTTYNVSMQPWAYGTVSEIDGDFSRKIAKFSHPRWRGSPWNWIPVLGIRKLEWWGYWAGEEVWRYLQPYGYNAPRDRRMDRHRATAKNALTHNVAR